MRTDPARRSAIAGAILGVACIAMGAAILAVSTVAPDASLHVPRRVVGAMGFGLAFCGASVAVATYRRRLAMALAACGIVLTFLLPIAWIAFGPGIRECATSLSFGFLSMQGRQSGLVCRGAFGLGTIFIVATLLAGAGNLVKGWASPAWAQRIEKSGEGVAALLAGVALLVLLGIAAPLLLARWIALRAYARLTGSGSRS